MPEGNRKAGLLLRVLGKALDLLIFLIALKTIPQAGAFVGLIYIFISDGLFDGRSAGKKILQLRVIGNESGHACGFRESVLRNLPIACACGLYLVPMIGWLLALAVCGMEFLLMFGNRNGRRLGDELAGTLVIEDRVESTAPASPGHQGDN